MMTRKSFFQTLLGGATTLAAAAHAKPTNQPAREAAGAVAGPKTPVSTPKPVPVAPPAYKLDELHFYYPETLTAHSEPAVLDVTSHSDLGRQFQTYRTSMEYEFSACLPEGSGVRVLEQCMWAIQDYKARKFVFHFQDKDAGSITVKFTGLLTTIAQESNVNEFMKVSGRVVVTDLPSMNLPV